MKTKLQNWKFFRRTIAVIILTGFCFTMSCAKRPQKSEEVFAAHLEAAGGKENWQKVRSFDEHAETSILIDKKEVSKSHTISKVLLPGFKKVETYSEDNLTNIELVRPENAYFVSLDQGNFRGISTIEKEQVLIKAELSLLKNHANWKFKEVTWNGKKVYLLESNSTGEKLIYDSESFRRIARVTNTPYGEATTYYTNFKKINGLDFPYEERQFIPAANYETVKKINTINLNNEFSPGEFELKENWISLHVGDTVPDYEMESLERGPEKISRKNLLGKVVLIDFWATWCKPCIKEFPNLKEQYKKYRDEGFEIVSISLDENQIALNNFMKNNDFPWKSVHLKKGFQSDLVQKFHVADIPKPILVGRDGKILAMDGEASGENLNKRLSNLFKKRTSGVINNRFFFRLVTE